MMDMLEQLDALMALHARATKKWRYHYAWNGGGTPIGCIEAVSRWNEAEADYKLEAPVEDALFLVTAANALPTIAAEYRRMARIVEHRHHEDPSIPKTQYDFGYEQGEAGVAAECQKLRAALEFYAAEASYHPHIESGPIGDDMGQRARDVLRGSK